MSSYFSFGILKDVFNITIALCCISRLHSPFHTFIFNLKLYIYLCNIAVFIIEAYFY